MSTIGIRVYFEDTDFSGRVYHGAYVRFLERGRTELLRESGVDHTALAERDPPIYFTLRRLDLVFKGPAAVDDWLVVETRASGMRRATFLMEQTIRRDERTLVSATAELCLIDGAGRPQRPPPLFEAAFPPGR